MQHCYKKLVTEQRALLEIGANLNTAAAGRFQAVELGEAISRLTYVISGLKTLQETLTLERNSIIARSKPTSSKKKTAKKIKGKRSSR